MRRSHLVYVGGVVVLLAILVIASVPARAQQIALHSVKPNRARAGEEVDLTIQGAGFCGPASVQIGAFEAADVRVESDSTIRATIYLPGDALPGSYPVLVIVDCGGPQETFSAALEEGFTVMEPVGGPTPEPRPGPGPEPGPEPPGPIDWWPVLLIVAVVGVIVVGGGLLTVTLAVRAHRATLKRQAQMQQEMQQAQQELEQLQEQAEEGELPEKCQPGKIKVIRDKPELKPGLWKVAGLQVTLYDAEQHSKEHDVPDELVKRIDEAARNKLLWGDSEALTAEIVEIGRALAAQVVDWQAHSQAGRDVRLEPQIAGGEGSVKFTLYRCVGEPDWWQTIKSWQAKAQAVKHFPQEFRGPTMGEAPEGYRAVLEKGITIYVRNLIREASRLWDTEGVGVSVEVSLE
jgi:Sec-independent protein translocase protein TatA